MWISKAEYEYLEEENQRLRKEARGLDDLLARARAMSIEGKPEIVIADRCCLLLKDAYDDLVMQLPAGYEAHMIPRSSTYKNFGIIQANHMGMFDESYCGDNDQWYFPAIAMRDTVIHAGERICQFRIVEHQPHLNFMAVETLGNSDRGGIGSTGVK